MDKSTIYQIEKTLLNDLKKATIAIMAQHKVDKDSDLSKSVNWVEKGDVITLIANDYFQYASTGRKSGIMPPPQDLIPWMKKNNIKPNGKQTYNQLAFAIANAIKKHGIKAKNYINPILELSMDMISEDIVNEVSENFTKELVEILEQNN